MECNHKNGIKSDNRVENLEWVTNQQNIEHSRKVLGYDNRGSKNHRTKLTAAQIKEIRAMSGVVSQRKIAAQFGVSQGHVGRVIKRKRWNHDEE
jgi:DNA-binding transcriptional regulator YiaG